MTSFNFLKFLQLEDIDNKRSVHVLTVASVEGTFPNQQPADWYIPTEEP